LEDKYQNDSARNQVTSPSLTGKVALVTGGSRGIGRAIALELADRGASIVFNYLKDHRSAQRVEQEICMKGVECLRFRAHLGQPERIDDLFEAINKKFGRLNILVNNAASGVQRTALELDLKHWNWTMDINTKAPWLCVKAAVPLMVDGGHIINITSLGSQRVLPYYLSVGISKAGLEALTRYLAVELGPLGINVNAVSGGYVDTDALTSFPNRKELLEKARGCTPAGRHLTTEDIARVVSFLCSEDAFMIRGQVIVVDGGVSLVH